MLEIKKTRHKLDPQLRSHLYAVLRELMHYWPYYSGDYFYPVPAPESSVYDPRTYYEAGNLYIGRNLAYRKNLLEWLAVQLRAARDFAEGNKAAPVVDEGAQL